MSIVSKETDTTVDVKFKKYVGKATPQTNIFNNYKLDIFSGVNLLSVEVLPSCQFTQYPLEDGMIVTDNKIDNQTKINVSCVVSDSHFSQIYKRINYARLSGTKFEIITKVDLYDNMYIASNQYTESKKFQNCINIELSFIEQQFAKKKDNKMPQSVVLDKDYSDTVPVYKIVIKLDEPKKLVYPPIKWFPFLPQ